MSENQTVIFVMALLGVLIGLVIVLGFGKKSVVWSAHADLMRNEETRAWLDAHCTTRELQAIEYVCMRQGYNHADVMALEKLAIRAPKKIARLLTVTAKRAAEKLQ